MATEFFRSPTSEEMKDFKPIPLVVQKNTVGILFKKKLEEVELDYLQKQKKPFCSRCAKIDFKDKLESQQEELFRKVRNQMDTMEKNQGFANVEKMNLDLDLSEYGNSERFTSNKDRDAMEIIPGMVKDGQIVRQIKTGIHRDYKCKVRGCGISIYLSFDDMKKLETVPKETDPVKVKK